MSGRGREKVRGIAGRYSREREKKKGKGPPLLRAGKRRGREASYMTLLSIDKKKGERKKGAPP